MDFPLLSVIAERKNSFNFHSENHFEQTNQIISSQFIDFFSTVTTNCKCSGLKSLLFLMQQKQECNKVTNNSNGFIAMVPCTVSRRQTSFQHGRVHFKAGFTLAKILLLNILSHRFSTLSCFPFTLASRVTATIVFLVY